MKTASDQEYCDSFVSLRALARQLGTSTGQFKNLAREAERSYREFEVIKPNGKKRPICDPSPELKEVQRQIVETIFNRIPLPSYVQGGVRGRSAYSNALVHAGNQRLVTIDIESFFTNVSNLHVYSMWIDLGFCTKLSGWLAKLTTRHGALPQGAPTSTPIANRILLKADERICKAAKDRGLAYSRYIDDLAVSGEYPEPMIGVVVGELQKLGLRSSKKKMSHRSRGNAKPQSITGYLLNNGKPSISKASRDATRQQIHGLKFMNQKSWEFRKRLESISGQIFHIRKTNPGSADRLRRQLATTLKEMGLD